MSAHSVSLLSLTLTRRWLLKAFTLTCAGAAGLISGVGVLRFLSYSGGEGGTREAPEDAVAALRSGHPLHVPSAGAWVIKQEGAQEILALDDRCPHLGCRYVYVPDAGRFRCPCHGSEFDLTGNVLLGPADRSPERLTVGPPSGGRVKLMKAANDAAASSPSSRSPK